MERKRDAHHFFTYLQKIRNFFLDRDFLDCLTPPGVSNPGIETHLHPFQLYSPHRKNLLNTYLHTSPEFSMKALLSEGLEKIFTLSYSFRDEPQGTYHRFQFIMLEWYRKYSYYLELAEDCQELLRILKQENISIERQTIDNLFLNILNFRITDFLEKAEFQKLITRDFKDIHLDKNFSYDWEDLFFLIFLNYIEPQLKDYSYLILYEYPAPLHALSTVKKNNSKVCERFELYINGIETANAFNELDCLYEQKRRFYKQAKRKKELYDYELPSPSILFNSLEKGIGPASGIALGVERLYRELFKMVPFWD